MLQLNCFYHWCLIARGHPPPSWSWCSCASPGWPRRRNPGRTSNPRNPAPCHESWEVSYVINRQRKKSWSAIISAISWRAIISGYCDKPLILFWQIWVTIISSEIELITKKSPDNVIIGYCETFAILQQWNNIKEALYKQTWGSPWGPPRASLAGRSSRLLCRTWRGRGRRCAACGPGTRWESATEQPLEGIEHKIW